MRAQRADVEDVPYLVVLNRQFRSHVLIIIN